jgi:hypothetical protein
MAKTWADDLTIFEALDIVGKIQRAVEKGEYGKVAQLLGVSKDWAGTPDELNDMLGVRFAALADRITKGGTDGQV